MLFSLPALGAAFSGGPLTRGDIGRMQGPMASFATDGALKVWLDRFLTPLDDPGSRLFYLNILAAALLAVFYLVVVLRAPLGVRSDRATSFRRRLANALGFRRKYWWNRSAKADYALYFLNSVLKVLLFIPFLDFGFRISQWTVNGLLAIGGDFVELRPSFGWLLAFTLASFVFDDFLRFFHHWLMHKVPWLWPFHVAHHSARVLTPMTLYRTHPVEAAMAAVRNSISLGVATGVFLFLFRGHFHVLTFFGVNAFGQMFNFLGANLRHSQLPLGFGSLEQVIISPAQHQIHHSRDERDFDRNFGVSLAIWDRLFGSLMLSGERTQALREGRLRFGVRGASAFDLQKILLGPFVPSHSPSRWGSHLGFNAVSGVLQEGKGVDVGENPKQTDSRPTDEIEPKGSSSVKSNLKTNLKINLKSKLAVLSMLAVGVSANAAHADLTIYTDRPTARVQTVADEYTQLTGEKVTIVEMAYGDLVKRLNAEGAASPADVLFVKDLVYLAELANDGRLQPMVSTVVDTEIAPQMKDPKNLWTAVTIRGRTLVYDPSRVDAKELKGYEDLAEVKWAGRLCVRTSKSAYNEALVAGLIEVHGYLKAKDIVDGWVQNLAADPMPNDNAVLEAVANGTCDVGITNTYYLGAAIAKNPAFPVRAHFADQNSTGMFGNGTGAGVAVNSKQSAAATKFIELLLSEKHQLAMSAAHFDYPAKMGLVPTTLVKDWGTPKYNVANWTKVGGRAAEARTIFSEVNYK